MVAGDPLVAGTYAEGEFWRTRKPAAARLQLTLKLVIADRNYLIPDATVPTRIEKCKLGAGEPA